MPKNNWRKVQHASAGVLRVKIAQRLAMLPPAREDGEPTRVLDAYSGDGDIWRAVSRWRPDLEVIGIEKDPKRGKAAIHADNRRVLKAMDLSRFDAIDLDAWGQPTDQMAIICDRGFPGVIFWTFIATYPRGSMLLLDAAKIPRAWERIAPTTMFSQGGVYELWRQFLATKGYDQMVVASASLGRYYGAVGYGTFDEAQYNRLLTAVQHSSVGARFGAPPSSVLHR
jgi:hypothetical protein